MNALAWSLLHFIWQGAAIAALAAVLMQVLKSPSTRYLIGLGAVALMLMSFAVTLSVLSGPAGNGAESSPPDFLSPVAANTWVPDNSAPLVDDRALLSGSDSFLWVARAWLVGVFALALRIVFGLLVLEQLRRRGLVELPAPLVARFRALQERVGITRFVRYCECQAVRVPAVIGLFRPVVLIPVRALTGLSVEQLEAVVAHELGHVKRFDVAVNFLQAIAETLFFFHPAVWWLSKRIRADREDCCDDVAVSVTGGKVGYARALAEMASWRDAPHFAMAATGGPIAARVARLLGVREHGAGARTAGAITASLALIIAVVAGGVSLGWMSPAKAAEGAKVEVAVPVASPRPAVSPAVSPRVAVSVKPVFAASPAAPAAPSLPAAPASPTAKAKPPRHPVPAAPPAPAAPAARSGSYIEDMKSAGYDDLDVDDLIAFKTMGVTPEYVKQVRDLGFTPDAHEIIAMKVQDISPEYVHQIRELGFKPDANEIIAMKVQGITPDYVRYMRAQGFDADANELIALKVQDITPEYRKQLESAGYKLDANELIQAKVMGITPEFVQKAASHGFKNLDFHKLIQLKNADIL